MIKYSDAKDCVDKNKQGITEDSLTQLKTVVQQVFISSTSTLNTL